MCCIKLKSISSFLRVYFFKSWTGVEICLTFLSLCQLIKSCYHSFLASYYDIPNFVKNFCLYIHEGHWSVVFFLFLLYCVCLVLESDFFLASENVPLLLFSGHWQFSLIAWKMSCHFLLDSMASHKKFCHFISFCLYIKCPFSFTAFKVFFPPLYH